MSFIAPLAELARNDLVQEKLIEAGRIFFSTGDVTINLLPALVAGALLLLLGLPLLALLFQPAAESTGSGYGAPAAEYGAPAPSYGSPSYSRSDEGYEEFRALFTGLLDSDPSAPHSELSKRMQELAQPLVAKLGDAAAKLIQ